MRSLHLISLNNFVSARGAYYGEYGICIPLNYNKQWWLWGHQTLGFGMKLSCIV